MFSVLVGTFSQRDRECFEQGRHVDVVDSGEPMPGVERVGRDVAMELSSRLSGLHRPCVAADEACSVVVQEVDRRDAGKWETVRRASVRMQARSLRSPRLDLSYIARDAGVLDTTETTVDYSLLVTVRTRPDITLYDDVRTTYQVLNPLTAARARTAVRVRT